MKLSKQLLEEAIIFFSKPMSENFIYNHGKCGLCNGGYTPPGFETVTISVDHLFPVKHDAMESFPPLLHHRIIYFSPNGS
jgi:hypothetical protein